MSFGIRRRQRKGRAEFLLRFRREAFGEEFLSPAHVELGVLYARRRSSRLSTKTLGNDSRCERISGNASLIHWRPGAPEAFSNGITIIVSLVEAGVWAGARTRTKNNRSGSCRMIELRVRKAL